jgi:Excalibur calcium-binding domain
MAICVTEAANAGVERRQPTATDEPTTSARRPAPLYRGQPGYRSALDRDDDGVACET